MTVRSPETGQHVAGVVKFVGPVDGVPGLHIGLKTDSPGPECVCVCVFISFFIIFYYFKNSPNTFALFCQWAHMTACSTGGGTLRRRRGTALLSRLMPCFPPLSIDVH